MPSIWLIIIGFCLGAVIACWVLDVTSIGNHTLAIACTFGFWIALAGASLG